MPQRTEEKKEPAEPPKIPKSYATTSAHRAGSKRWNLKNKEQVSLYMKSYYAANKERILKQKKVYRLRKKTEKLKHKVLVQLKEKVPEKNYERKKRIRI